jgi:putative DNA primase/helicase
VGDVTPFGKDTATQKQHELVAAISGTKKFGTAIQQEGSNGQEFLFHCPICTSDDGKGPGHRPHLRISRATRADRDIPFVGCRIHDSSADYSRIRQALLSAGVPANLLDGGTSKRSGRRPGQGNALGTEGLDQSAYAEYKSRPSGLGETNPIPEGRVQRWAAAIWEDEDAAVRALDYLTNKRGLLENTIKAAELGLSGNRIILPIRGADGSVVAARYRPLKKDGTVGPWKPLPHPKLKKEDGKTPETYGAPTRLYGVRELALDLETTNEPMAPVWLCAGELDRLTLFQCGLLSVSPTNGEGSLARLQDAEYLVGRDVYIVFDCDKAGRKGARKNAVAASKLGARSVRILDLDPDRNDGYDVSDFFLDNDTPEFDALQLLSDKVSLTEPFELPAGSELSFDELSDRRMAEMVADRCCDGIKYVVPSRTWIEWDGKRWQQFPFQDNSPATNSITGLAREIKVLSKTMEDVEFADTIKGWASQYLNRSHASVREHLTTLGAMRVPLEELDRAPVLNTPTGILDLETGDVRPHDPASYLRWMTKGSFVPGWKSDPIYLEKFGQWNQFLKRIIPSPALRRYVQKLLGYSLLDGNPHRLLIFIKGGTSTGKSVFAETVMEALGSYAGPFNMSLLRDNQDEKPRADIVESLTQRVIFASETSSAWHLHGDAIKRMTGGDTIKARLPHRGEYFERIPAFTPWIRTNEVPQVTAADMALDRRLIVIPFDAHISAHEERPAAMNRLRRESVDAVITWAVGGLRRFLREGFDDLPAETVRAKYEFSSQLSPMHEFIEEMCERGEPDDTGYEIPIAELFNAYSNWAFANGIQNKDHMSKIEFGRKLSGIGVGTRIANSVRHRTGIRLRQTTESRMK